MFEFMTTSQIVAFFGGILFSVLSIATSLLAVKYAKFNSFAKTLVLSLCAPLIAVACWMFLCLSFTPAFLSQDLANLFTSLALTVAVGAMLILVARALNKKHPAEEIEETVNPVEEPAQAIDVETAQKATLLLATTAEKENEIEEISEIEETEVQANDELIQTIALAKSIEEEMKEDSEEAQIDEIEEAIKEEVADSIEEEPAEKVEEIQEEATEEVEETIEEFVGEDEIDDAIETNDETIEEFVGEETVEEAEKEVIEEIAEPAEETEETVEEIIGEDKIEEVEEPSEEQAIFAEDEIEEETDDKSVIEELDERNDEELSDDDLEFEKFLEALRKRTDAKNDDTDGDDTDGDQE